MKQKILNTLFASSLLFGCATPATTEQCQLPNVTAGYDLKAKDVAYFATCKQSHKNIKYTSHIDQFECFGDWIEAEVKINNDTRFNLRKSQHIRPMDNASFFEPGPWKPIVDRYDLRIEFQTEFQNGKQTIIFVDEGIDGRVDNMVLVYNGEELNSSSKDKTIQFKVFAQQKYETTLDTILDFYRKLSSENQ